MVILSSLAKIISEFGSSVYVILNINFHSFIQSKQLTAITISFSLIYKPLIFMYVYFHVFIVLVKPMDLPFSVHHVKCSIIYFLLSGLFLIFWLIFGH